MAATFIAFRNLYANTLPDDGTVATFFNFGDDTTTATPRETATIENGAVRCETLLVGSFYQVTLDGSGIPVGPFSFDVPNFAATVAYFDPPPASTAGAISFGTGLPPNAPNDGQLYFDKTGQTLYTSDGFGNWTPVLRTTKEATPYANFTTQNDVTYDALGNVIAGSELGFQFFGDFGNGVLWRASRSANRWLPITAPLPIFMLQNSAITYAPGNFDTTFETTDVLPYLTGGVAPFCTQFSVGDIIFDGDLNSVLLDVYGGNGKYNIYRVTAVSGTTVTYVCLTKPSGVSGYGTFGPFLVLPVALFTTPTGTAFPDSPYDGQQFYRKDLKVLAIYDKAAVNWISTRDGSDVT